MSHTKHLLILSVGLMAIAASGASTTTYYVGHCRVGSFSTISDALAAKPAPDVVYVCPGTYPEQLTITKPVMLAGIPSGGANQVFITVPSGGLKPSCETTGNQVCVLNTGPVNIVNIAIDGTGATSDGGSVSGIFYQNSSGTVNHVETRFQKGNPGGVGIEIFQSQEQPNTVTVENSNIHSFTGWGIQAVDDSSSGDESTLKVLGNTISAEPEASGGIVSLGGASVSISGNVIHGPEPPTSGTCKGGSCIGILVYLPLASSITKNTIVGSGNTGIELVRSTGASTTSVSSNTIFDIGGDGVQLVDGCTESCSPDDSVSIEGNIITQTQNGINFFCNAFGTARSNTISAIHSSGLANVPAGFSSSNSYFNVPTISSSGTCP